MSDSGFFSRYRVQAVRTAPLTERPVRIGRSWASRANLVATASRSTPSRVGSATTSTPPECSGDWVVRWIVSS